jgi:hypothetical protein
MHTCIHTISYTLTLIRKDTPDTPSDAHADRYTHTNTQIHRHIQDHTGIEMYRVYTNAHSHEYYMGIYG